LLQPHGHDSYLFLATQKVDAGRIKNMAVASLRELFQAVMWIIDLNVKLSTSMSMLWHPFNIMERFPRMTENCQYVIS